MAVKCGVARLVLRSGRGEPEAQRCEQIVWNSGAQWTVVRSSWFAQNFSENYLLDPILAGEVALPVGSVGEPFVDADDISDVAVVALTDDRMLGTSMRLQDRNCGHSQKPLVKSAVRQTAISVTSQCTKRNTLLSEERGVAAGFGEPHPVFV